MVPAFLDAIPGGLEMLIILAVPVVGLVVAAGVYLLDTFREDSASSDEPL